MAKKTVKESALDALPERIRSFPWAHWHFYKGKGQNPKMSLNKNFVVEAMRFFKIHYNIMDYQIIPLPNKKEPLVAMKVQVSSSDPNSKGFVTEGFATVEDKSYDSGQSHFGQQALNRALANAVERWLEISDHDVEVIISTKNLSKDIRVVIDDTPEPTPAEEITVPTGNITDF